MTSNKKAILKQIDNLYNWVVDDNKEQALETLSLIQSALDDKNDE